LQSLDLEVLEHARQWMSAGRNVWLVTVTQTFGASPRPPGSLMAMRDDGVVIGSVSGGCIEDDLVARRDQFRGSKPLLERYGITSEDARRFGLPCGGELEVVIESAVESARLRELSAKIAAGEVFVRNLDLETGQWQFRPATESDTTGRTEREFACIHGPRWRLLIIGASEIARYLAEVAATLDFQVSDCDPREEYRSVWRVPATTFLDGMPDDAVLAFKPDGHTVVVAVSHDPKLDDLALMEALKTPAFYVGAVGSSKTSEERRTRLLEFDVSPAQVAKLHGPVGLSIGSRTPPEIAIAILAELVAARNGLVLAASRMATYSMQSSAA